ncbi:Beta-glucuronosyltransferase GlcAT14B [Castilleja foliolosa]|uniref:Beta-glucuronosyltransferase GlcAT14B n=1 Tax=Castilleja foliolosa TaxID=1961234 RepID=A0ABD3CK30_9LAMI
MAGGSYHPSFDTPSVFSGMQISEERPHTSHSSVSFRSYGDLLGWHYLVRSSTTAYGDGITYPVPSSCTYYANFLSSPEGYFHTVVCNAQEFQNTTINTDLHFISWDNPPKQHPHHLNLNDMKKMVDSNAPFARKFTHNVPVLDKIDQELLFRGKDMLVPGGWCVAGRVNGSDPCSEVGSITVLRPTDGAKRLEKLTSSLLSDANFRPRQCK